MPPNENVAAPAPTGYVTHTSALPCRECGTLTTTSRLEPKLNGAWLVIPLCTQHLPARSNGG